MLEDVVVGVATELVASGIGLALAAAVLLPGVTRLVVAVAVELDRQPVLGPAAVHASCPGRAVRLREHEPGVAQSRQKPRFELAERDANLSMQDLPELAAPGLFGRRSSTASTMAGVVPCRTPAS